MKKSETVKAKHLNSGEVKEFTLVATALKRQRKGEPEKLYPWFQEKEATFSNLCNIFGKEMLEEMAVDSLNREFQLLYFQRSPSGEQVPVLKDGQPVKLPDGKLVTQADETPRMEQFLEYLMDEKLSGREITPEYLMRKAIKATSEGNTTKAMEYMMKAQEMMAKAMQG